MLQFHLRLERAKTTVKYLLQLPCDNLSFKLVLGQGFNIYAFTSRVLHGFTNF